MNVALDSSILFISDSNWSCEAKKTIFLDTLIQILDYISQNKEIKICWNSACELALWDAPQKAPWRVDKDIKNKMIPYMYTTLAKNTISIEESNKYDECIVTPIIQYDNDIIKYKVSLYKILHYYLHKNENIFFAIKSDFKQNYEFSCNCNINILKPYVVSEKYDFIAKDEILRDLWPICRNECDKVYEIIRYFSWYYAKKDFIYSYQFKDTFIKSIITVPFEKRERLIKQLIKRLTITTAEAKRDPSLKDEYIDTVCEYRIRITPEPTSTRVHYIFANDEKKEIVFLQYYSTNEHDDGLS